MKEATPERPYLTVVIPAYNEEDRLPSTLHRILSYLEGREYDSEVIVVDDHSRDRTSAIAREILAGYSIPFRILRNEPNRGKGFSIRRGMEAAQGELILFSDADLSTPIEELESLEPPIRNGHDIAIGSRGLKSSQVEIHQAWYREYMGKTFNLLVRMVAFGGIHDTQCGFKLFRAEVAKDLLPHLLLDGWAFDVEMLYLAMHRNHKVAEVPVHWQHKDNSRVNPIKDSTKMFLDLLRIRWNHLTGKYRGYLGRAKAG